MLGVRGPFGTGWDLSAAAGRDLLVVAGGIGLAPLRPVVNAALAAPGRYGRLNVLIGARTPRDLLYTREADELAGGRCPGRTSPSTGPTTAWTGDVGVVTTLLDRAGIRSARSGGVRLRARGDDPGHRPRTRPPRPRPDRIRVSLERTMHCGTGHCGHCQLGPLLLCRDGPVVDWTRAEPLLSVREL